MIDLHAHILYGLDDGAQFLEESVRMARAAERDGIRKMVATPHVYRRDFEKPRFAEIGGKIAELRMALKQSSVNIELYPGAEVHISHDLVAKVRENRKFLMLNQSSYVLIEFPSDHIFAHVRKLFFDLMSEQITPIIAHPERNYVFIEHPSLLYELIEVGALVQSNSGSFTGTYGKKVQRAAFTFLKLRFIHLMGSDTHNAMSLSPRMSEARRIVAEFSGEKVAQAIFYDNSLAVLNDGDLPYCPEPLDPRKMRKTLKIRMPSFKRK